MYIPIILGTAREGRNSEKAAAYMLQQTQKLEGVETELLDVRDFRIPASDNTENSDAAKRFSESSDPYP